MRRPGLVALFLLTALGLSAPATARAESFNTGAQRLSLSLGATTGASQTYFVVGAGYGVFVARGLEVSVEADHWLGGSPTVTRLSPGVTYVVAASPSWRPYIGAFARRWFIGDQVADVLTAGARGGVVWAESESGYLMGGAVYEAVLTECALDCSYVYPEISLAFTL